MNVVAGCRPWNKALFAEHFSRLPGWIFVSKLDELPAETKRIFFVNWLERVPDRIWREVECIAFHAAPLPYGRGASPIQHQILAGLETTTLTAFRMVEQMDAGPIYVRRTLSLLGAAEEIYLRAANLALAMAREIVELDLQPQPQKGEVTTFKRRKPAESEINPDTSGWSLSHVHNFIRMLDCAEFPPAFIRVSNLKIEFTRATRRHDRIEANVVIREISE